MSNIARYTAGHLFRIDGTRSLLVEKIATALGGVTEADLGNLDLFIGRTNKLC